MRSPPAPLWMAAGAMALLGGLGAGLVRAGLPGFQALADLHGPLMIGGFLGTLISLERAVAVRAPWSYLAPTAAGAGGVSLLVGARPGPAPVLLVFASLVLVAAYAPLLRRRADVSMLVMAAGAAAWTVGNLLWLVRHAVSGATPWWVAFLVLTIAGERLELARITSPTRAAHLVLAALVVAGGVSPLAPSGTRGLLVGPALAGLAVWLTVWDIPRRTLRFPGRHRFLALCLLAGYAWLVVAGILVTLGAAPGSGWRWDAALHAILLGFVFSMIFGHAPIVVPMLLRRPLPWHGGFYLPLLLLHATLAVRIVGDLSGHAPSRVFGSAGNVASILLFLLLAVVAVVRGTDGSADHGPAAGLA